MPSVALFTNHHVPATGPSCPAAVFDLFPTTARDQPHSQIKLGIISLTIMSAQPPNKGSRRKRKYNPTSGLIKDVLETLSLPTLEGSERDIVPEDLVYIGSYNWVDSPNPMIIVPG